MIMKFSLKKKLSALESKFSLFFFVSNLISKSPIQNHSLQSSCNTIFNYSLCCRESLAPSPVRAHLRVLQLWMELSSKVLFRIQDHQPIRRVITYQLFIRLCTKNDLEKKNLIYFFTFVSCICVSFISFFVNV